MECVFQKQNILAHLFIQHTSFLTKANVNKIYKPFLGCCSELNVCNILSVLKADTSSMLVFFSFFKNFLYCRLGYCHGNNCCDIEHSNDKILCFIKYNLIGVLLL